jgi:octanoyl-[GcvH]:protein N-octanoyltransferase
MTVWNPDSDAPLRILRAEASGDAVADLHAGIDLLTAVRSGEAPATLRIYRPDPTLAFGQRDVRLPGYAAAAAAAGRAGFAPVVRKAGGRAAAYHRGTLIVDHVEPADEAMLGHQQRFKVLGALYASALRSLGADAAVGEIPGEYCAGEYSVHGLPGEGSTAVAPVKLVGTAQRVVAGAWLFASVFVVKDSAPIRGVLTDVYAAMGLPLVPSTAGAVEDLVPGTTVQDVESALLGAYSEHVELSGR